MVHLFGNCKLILSFELIKIFIIFNIKLETEMHLTREFGNFHYGWFCNLAVDFNKSKENPKNNVFFREFSNAVLSASEIGEIRNQINYMLEAEDDADEEFFNDFSDPFVVETDDPFVVETEDPFKIEDSDPFVVIDE